MAERTSVSVSYSPGQEKTVIVDAAKTVKASESGTTFVLDAAAGAAITLPSLAAGLSYKFVVGAAFATSDWVVSSAEGDNISGNLIVNGAAVPAAAEDNITFELGAESIGDWAMFVADASNSQWIVTGIGNLATSVTANDPS